MGYKFGKRSQFNLSEAHPLLIDLCNEVIQVYDFAVIEGHRGKIEQNKAYFAGKSGLKWPKSKHNQFPSLAVDLFPAPYQWNNYKAFYYFAGIVKGIAHGMELNIRWGGDWDGDNSFVDQNFHDLPHFELVGGF